MTTKFVTEYIDKKINENENFICGQKQRDMLKLVKNQ